MGRGASGQPAGRFERRMGLHARRFGIIVVALSVLSVALVACSAAPSTGATGGSGQNFTFITPSAGSPTPTFPPFTLGAWPSNYSPNDPDTITLYAICRTQDQTMQTPPTPAAGLTVTFLVGAPVNQSPTAVTGADGVAAAQLAFSDPSPGTPVTVTVTVTYKGQSYVNTTFFTPGATDTPTPTVNPNATPGAGATPSATP